MKLSNYRLTGKYWLDDFLNCWMMKVQLNGTFYSWVRILRHCARYKSTYYYYASASLDW